MKVPPAIRVALTLFGILIVFAAFGGVIVVGALRNPPPLRIAVAFRELPAGAKLQPDDIKIEDQMLDPRLASLYVQEVDLNAYIGATSVDNIRRGEPLIKDKFATDDAARSSNRYSAQLTDPNLVVITLPANPDIIPGKVKAGDFVNIIFAAGAETNLSRLPSAKDPQVGVQFAAPANASPEVQQIDGMQMTMTVAQNTVDLPLADVLLEHVEILDVNYAQAQNAMYSNADAQSAQAYSTGPISGIIVRVPRSYQAFLAFAAANGKIRYAVSSPLLDAKTIQPQAGVDWGKVIEMYRWKSQQSLERGETLTTTLYPNLSIASPISTTAKP